MKKSKNKIKTTTQNRSEILEGKPEILENKKIIKNKEERDWRYPWEKAWKTDLRIKWN